MSAARLGRTQSAPFAYSRAASQRSARRARRARRDERSGAERDPPAIVAATLAPGARPVIAPRQTEGSRARHRTPGPGGSAGPSVERDLLAAEQTDDLGP